MVFFRRAASARVVSCPFLENDKVSSQPQSAGVLPEGAVLRAAPSRPPKTVIDRFLALEDLSGTVSDVLDQFGICGTVGSSIVKPTITTARIVGTAITIRNVPQDEAVLQNITANRNLMTEIEGIHQAQSGDVLVIQGVRNVSNMGGIMATLAKRQGISGAVVDGAIRDAGQSRRIGFPVWSSDISPITGKWRCVTVEINGTVTITGLSVRSGDLVIADETGTCFVPLHLVDEVLKRAEAITHKEREILRSIDSGISVPDLGRALFSRSK
jgi:regulator of RNase E activity RraA